MYCCSLLVDASGEMDTELEPYLSTMTNYIVNSRGHTGKSRENVCVTFLATHTSPDAM